MNHEQAKLEADIATIYAKLRASSLIRHQKEPYDTPTAMMPVAYAMFEVLVDVGGGSGRELEWHQFLRESLAECIVREELKMQDEGFL
jgi:hypothetical protein